MKLELATVFLQIFGVVSIGRDKNLAFSALRAIPFICCCEEFADWLKETVKGKDKIFTIFVECSHDSRVYRNQRRLNPIPLSALLKIKGEFERLSTPDLIINTDKVRPMEAVKIILKTLEDIKEP